MAETGRLCFIFSEKVPCEGQGRKIWIQRWHQYKCSKSLTFNYWCTAKYTPHCCLSWHQPELCQHLTGFPKRPLRIGGMPGALSTLDRTLSDLSAVHTNRGTLTMIAKRRTFLSNVIGTDDSDDDWQCHNLRCPRRRSHPKTCHSVSRFVFLWTRDRILFLTSEMEVIRSKPGHLATGCSLRNVSVVVVAHVTAGSGLSGSLEWPRLLSPWQQGSNAPFNGSSHKGSNGDWFHSAAQMMAGRLIEGSVSEGVYGNRMPPHRAAQGFFYPMVFHSISTHI